MRQNFYFFRHGQTNENAAGAREGNKVESFLTPTGVKQAKRLAEYLSDKNYRCDLFIASKTCN